MILVVVNMGDSVQLNITLYGCSPKIVHINPHGYYFIESTFYKIVIYDTTVIDACE